MTTEEMLIFDGVASAELREWMQSQPRPLCVLGRAVPESLDSLTYGELIELQMCGSTITDAVLCLCRVILGITNTRKVMRCDAGIMAGFIFWATAEVERIGKLFANVQRQPTAEEIQAGIHTLQFGAFGTADWYARRMGMTSHDDAFATKWVRIYQCLKMDNELEDYRNRLTKIKQSKK